MPSRLIAARELSDVFKTIAHPDRIRLIEELHIEERDVNSLAQALDIPAARVSQHLSLLRAHRLVEERRDGRHHIYHLTQPEIANWIIEGLSFLQGRLDPLHMNNIEDAKALWRGSSRAK